MTITFINTLDNIFPRFIKLMQIYIPAISIPKDNILKKKNENISFIITFLSNDFELNTNNLFVTKANITAQSQLRQFAVNTLASFEAKSAELNSLINIIYEPQLTMVESTPKNT